MKDEPPCCSALPVPGEPCTALTGCPVPQGTLRHLLPSTLTSPAGVQWRKPLCTQTHGPGTSPVKTVLMPHKSSGRCTWLGPALSLAAPDGDCGKTSMGGPGQNCAHFAPALPRESVHHPIPPWWEQQTSPPPKTEWLYPKVPLACTLVPTALRLCPGVLAGRAKATLREAWCCWASAGHVSAPLQLLMQLQPLCPPPRTGLTGSLLPSSRGD